MGGENNATAASLYKNCILLIPPFKEKKDVSFLFGTYYFAKERSSQRSDRRLGREQESCSKDLLLTKQNDGRLIPFTPSKVTWSF